MSISTEITRLQNAKASIKTSIENKGVTVPSSAKLDDYSSYIDQISAGGGSNTDLVDLIEGNLTSLSSSEVEEVAPFSFYYDKVLQSINLPNVKVICECAFASSILGGDISLPKLEYFLGYNSSSVSLIFSKSNITSFSAPNFTGTRAVKTNPSDYAINGFSGCTSLKTVNTPYIQYVGQAAFSGCTSLENVTFSSNFKSVGNYGFYNCYTLTEFPYDDVATSFGEYSFSGCKTITEIYAPNATVVGKYAFDGCTSLTTFTAKNSQILTYTFRNCSSLTTMTLLKTSVCSLANTTNCLPASSTHHITIYVPSDLVESYKTATNWSTLYNNGYITFMAIEE